MVGGTCVVTALLAIFIYSSRLYTNRTVLAGVGKAYIPVEEGEVGKSVRKMVVGQLERSAIVAWESRPRDLLGEILVAEQAGTLPPETMSVGRNDYTVGREVPVDPANPPWGHIRHAGWTSPSQGEEEQMTDLQFANVIAELPNLVEARAVSLAPADPAGTPPKGPPMADPVVADVLLRPETMGMRDYLTQLSYLGLVNPPEISQKFLTQYENARFCGSPISDTEFKSLMAGFGDLLAGMTEMDPAITQQIHDQVGDKVIGPETVGLPFVQQASPPRTPDSSSIPSPITARTQPSRITTPYLQQEAPSEESMSSVLHRMPDDMNPAIPAQARSSSSLGSECFESDAGSVVRHNASPDANG